MSTTPPVSREEIEAIAERNRAYVLSGDSHWAVGAIETLRRALAERDATIDRLEKLVYVPGILQCAKCKFSLMKTTLFARTGAFASDSSPDTCPNCNVPMWRVTERDAGNDLCNRLDVMAGRISACREYLKDGETPAQCIQRNRDDVALALGQLAKVTGERDQARERLAAYDAALEGVRAETPEIKEALKAARSVSGGMELPPKGYERADEEAFRHRRNLLRLVEKLMLAEAANRNAIAVAQVRISGVQRDLTNTEEARCVWVTRYAEQALKLQSAEARAGELDAEVIAARKQRNDECRLRRAAESFSVQLLDQVTSLRSVLEFYAQEGHWENDRADYGSTTVAVPYTAAIYSDCGKLAQSALASHLPATTTGRTPEQYAIEHGRYLTSAAERFIDCVNELDLIHLQFDEDTEVDMTKAEALEESRGEYLKALKSAIYEFTKRADRAYPLVVAHHPDDAAVDRFSVAMKAKLAKKRGEGRGGWEDPEVISQEQLWFMMEDHCHKGDPIDVGNFAMMIWNRSSNGTL